jgi:signal transduction histidine kinase
MLGATGAFVVMLLLLEAVDSLQTRDTRRTIDLIEDEAFPSVQLVDRVANDVLRERVLIDRHIATHDNIDMQRIEDQIEAVRRDYAARTRQYTAIAMLPGEAYVWSALSADVTAAAEGERVALGLSRQNRNAEAQAQLERMAPLFSRIDRGVQQLISINQRAAEDSVAELRQRHRRYKHTRLILIATMLLCVVVGGVWITRRVVQAQVGLARFNEELENRNRELDAFASRIAHDLRGPLSTIGLSAEVLATTTPAAKTSTTTIARSVGRIARLIDDLLMLSRVGTMPRAAARPEAIAASLYEDLGRLVDEAGGTLRVDLAPASVSCSDALLRQVLWNLGENAVKYRRPDVPPEIEIVGRAEHGRYTIRVCDNGMGMSDEDTRRAFEPFYRGREASAIGGTGLGLAIVRRIVDACGGRITVDSKLGRGTMFAVELPLAAAGA